MFHVNDKPLTFFRSYWKKTSKNPMIDTSIENVLIRESRVALKTSRIFSSPGIHSPLTPGPWIDRFTDSAPNTPGAGIEPPHRTEMDGSGSECIKDSWLLSTPPPAKGEHQPPLDSSIPPLLDRDTHPPTHPPHRAPSSRATGRRSSRRRSRPRSPAARAARGTGGRAR